MLQLAGPLMVLLKVLLMLFGLFARFRQSPRRHRPRSDAGPVCFGYDEHPATHACHSEGDPGRQGHQRDRGRKVALSVLMAIFFGKASCLCARIQPARHLPRVR